MLPFFFCQNRVTFSTTMARLCLLKPVDVQSLTVPLTSTVAIITVWCAVKLIDIEPRAVPDSSIGMPPTAEPSPNPAETDLSTDSTFLHCRMAPVQPTSSFCATTVCWDTNLRHLCACCPVKAVPTRNKTGIVTFVAISAMIARVVADETVCFAEHCVVWAFPRNWKQNDVISTLWPNDVTIAHGGILSQVNKRRASRTIILSLID